MITKEELIELERLAKEGDADALFEGIKSCQRRSTGSVINLFERDDVSDAVILAAMDVCRDDYCLSDYIAHMVREKNKSDEIMIKGMEICERHSKLSVLFDLENKKGLSDPVIIKLADILAERGWISRTRNLLHRPDISDSVKEKIEKIVERAERNEQDPMAIAKKCLGGDGVLSEKPRNMRGNGPKQDRTKGKVKT